MKEHAFDMAPEAFELDLFAEELPNQSQPMLDQTLSTGSSGACGLGTLGTLYWPSAL